jgi:hypothetical protein
MALCSKCHAILNEKAMKGRYRVYETWASFREAIINGCQLCWILWQDLRKSPLQDIPQEWTHPFFETYWQWAENYETPYHFEFYSVEMQAEVKSYATEILGFREYQAEGSFFLDTKTGMPPIFEI